MTLGTPPKEKQMHDNSPTPAAGRRSSSWRSACWWCHVDNTILNVALPTIREELDASSSQLQWIVDSYLLVFAGLLLAAGSLGDRFGRRRALFRAWDLRPGSLWRRCRAARPS